MSEKERKFLRKGPFLLISSATAADLIHAKILVSAPQSNDFNWDGEQEGKFTMGTESQTSNLEEFPSSKSRGGDAYFF